ncbi:MAG: DNRLRE domain-containing protein [Pirellulaceae bacterium]
MSNVATVTTDVTKASDLVTISFQDGVYPAPNYRGTRDTKIRGDLPARILGTSRKLEVDGKPDIATLLKWDISAIPAGSFVQSAAIAIEVVNTSNDVFEVYQVLQPWSETEANFNERQSEVSWQVAGAVGATDRGSTVLGTVTAPSLGSVTIDLNNAGRTVVQSWIDNSSENFGFTFQDYSNASTQDLEFSSREQGTVVLRPKLTIVYSGEPADLDRASGFEIDLIFADDSMTPSQRQAFTQAASRWGEVIIGDLPELTNRTRTIDDLLIEVSSSRIDGAGGVLAHSAPTYVRSGTFLPARGVMRLDEADIAALEARGHFADLIMHEMGHVLGIGTIWRSLGLLEGSGSSDPRFTGPAATAEYNKLFGLNGSSVPVENTGDIGTRDMHWRESVLGSELMTGNLDGGINPLSRVTIASLQDLGYQVNLAAADPFSPPSLPGSIGDSVDGSVHAPWRNSSNAADVNDDGYVSPLDALYIINDLNSKGARPLPKSKTASTPFVDVSGDNFISSLDVLMVINSLNEMPVAAEAEGPVNAGKRIFVTRNNPWAAGNAKLPAVDADQCDTAFAQRIEVSSPGDIRTSDRRDELREELVDAVLGDDTEFEPLFAD